MKKTAFCSIICCAALLCGAAETTDTAGSFLSVRSGAISAKRLKSLRSAKLVYRSYSKADGQGYVMIRAQRPGQVRFDVASPEESFSACLNGNGSWSSAPQKEVNPLSADAEMELLQHVALMPVPFIEDAVYAPPKLLREETEDKKLCDVYETTPLKGDKFQLLLWIDKKSKRLLKSEIIDQEGNHSVFQLRNYRSYNGVPLATRFYITGPDTFYTLVLQSAVWNPNLAADVFARPAKGPAMPAFVSGATVKKTAVKKTASDSPEAKELRRTIRELELKIKNGEERLESMEKLFMSNKSDITSLTATTQQNRTRTYANKKSFRVKNYSSKNNLSRSGKKLLKQLNKTNEQVLVQYQALNKSVQQLKIRLGDAQDRLAALEAPKK